jgi:cellulose synthase/poly-beta-1,6-N-acetylglucosamine synthase-like glycosyltransferase
MEEIKKFVKEKPALIVGTVSSDRKGLISAFRTYEYGISHKIYKYAQNAIGAITVAPGCASLYRSDVIEQLNIQSSTLTEDFDLTIQIHQKKLGKIIYAPSAVVTTQDPLTFRDYWKQILRWNTGTWQNIFLHKLYKPNSKLNLELFFLLLDNFLWIATLVFVILHPLVLLVSMGFTLATISVLALMVALIEKKYWVLPYIILFPVFFYINIVAFYYSIFRVLFGKKGTLLWNKASRYAVSGTRASTA